MNEADGKSVDSIGEFTLISCGFYSTFALTSCCTGAWSVVLWLLVFSSLVSCFLVFLFLFSWLFVVCFLDSIGCIWTVIS